MTWGNGHVKRAVPPDRQIDSPPAARSAAARRALVKALVIHGPGQYSVEPEWPVPAVRPGWALLRVRFAGICGSDLVRFGRTGSYRHPMVLGHEFAGTVEEPSPGSARFARGDAAAALPLIPCGSCEGCLSGEPFHCSSYQFLGSRNDGGFAHYCLVPEDNLLALPPGTDLRTGAFMEPIAVGLHVVRRSGFSPGSTALVFGAGSIGLLVGLWLRYMGAPRVVFCDLRADSLAMAKRLGFSEAVLPDSAAFATLPRFDSVFEAAGSGNALRAGIDKTRDLGSLTVVGRDPAETRIPHDSFEKLMRREIAVKGCWGYNMKGEEQTVLGALNGGALPVSAMVTQETSLEDAPRLIRAMIEGSLYYCKAMIAL